MIVSEVVTPTSKIYSLQEWMENPPDNQEWVDGELVEKNGMTLQHGKVQGNLYFYWRNYQDSSGLGGKLLEKLFALKWFYRVLVFQLMNY